MKHFAIRPQPKLSQMTKQRPSAQRGLTLVELMVAMALSLVIAIAAVAALTVARRGFTTVDAASQLRDNGRFATDILQRLGVQAGYQDVPAATTVRRIETGVATNPKPGVSGLNNTFRAATDVPDAGTAWSAGDPGYGSDILVLRYQAAETFPGSGISDRTMLNCLGSSAGNTIPADRNRDERMVSILHVAESQGELSLMCTSTVSGTVPGFNDIAPTAGAQPLVRGVESFQVLYGVDGTLPTAANPEPDRADRYLRADEIIVPGDDLATNNAWRRVRSIRIGMVIRGPAGSSQDNEAQTLFPFGPAKAGAAAAKGSAFVSANDPGTSFTTPTDGRLRQVVTFTIHLRNFQDQCAGTTCS